jgi:hypothetical protein
MAVRRVIRLDETFNLLKTTAETVEQLRQSFITRAKFERAEVERRNKPTKTKVIVGGVVGAPESNVKLGQTIVYEFSYMKNIVTDIWNTLHMNSPVHDGPDSSGQMPDSVRYIDNHLIIAGGEVYNKPDGLPDDVTEVTFINLVPYARKIEFHGWGKKGTAGFHVPYHTYEITANQMRKYGNFVNIKFTYTYMSGFEVGKYSRSKSISRQSSSARYPSIVISLR